MRRLFWLAPIGLLLAAFSAACGGGQEDPRTFPEYIDRLDAIFGDATTRADEINAKFRDANAEAETDEEHMDAFRGLFKDMERSLRRVVDELESFRPPSPILDEEHDELAASAASIASILEDFSRRADESESLDEMRELFAELDEPRYDDAALRMSSACLLFEYLARDNGIDVELGCAFSDLGDEQAD